MDFENYKKPTVT